MAGKPLKKSVKRIFKLSGLITLKEGYLLASNLIGLVYHPFLTLRQIKKRKDKSQTMLIILFISFPLFLSLFLTTVGIIISHFFNLPFINYFKAMALFSDILTLLILSLSIFYLFYWTIQVIKKNHFYCSN